MENKEQAQQAVYKETIDSLMQQTQSSTDGLSTTQAKEKLERDGLNQLKEKAEEANLEIVLRNFQRCNGYRIADCRTDSDGHG